MALAVKICGLTDPEAVAAAVEGGARYLGFVFYPRSPRALSPERAGDLARAAPPDRTTVGVFVDPDDALLDRVLARVPLAAVQLHGAESLGSRARGQGPHRLRRDQGAAGGRIRRPGARLELRRGCRHAAVRRAAAQGARSPAWGNGLAFDWRLLQDLRVGCPWLLSGGLSADNLAAAITLCRPPAVDVSSGVESRPGHKDPAKIRRFLALARGLAVPEPATCATSPSSR